MLRQLTRRGSLRYSCPICGASFDDRTELNYHAWRRHGGAGRSYRCADCDQVFASERRLLEHVARAHGGA